VKGNAEVVRKILGYAAYRRDPERTAFNGSSEGPGGLGIALS
jgi:hypothetical protein